MTYLDISFLGLGALVWHHVSFKVTGRIGVPQVLAIISGPVLGEE